MDKRIIWFALIVIFVVVAIFIFRGRNKAVVDRQTGSVVITPNFTITPGVIREGDSIHFEDHTAGATSWQWDFSDGAGSTSTQQSGFTTYYKEGMYTVRLIINDSITDSRFVEVLTKGKTLPVSSKLPPQIGGPKTAFVGESVTFTDKTPGAEHTNWLNYATAEIKKDSKTYTTIFSRRGSFKIVATNEKYTGQGLWTINVVDKRPEPVPPTPDNKVKKTNNDVTVKSEDKKNLPPSPLPVAKHPSDAELKRLFSYVSTGKEEFTVKYKPIKNAIGDETIPVIIKGAANTEKKLYGFCQYLDFSKPTVLDVRSDWDFNNGFKTITVTVKD